ncbi:MAG: class I SAM-dependent methyltransferase [Candidatus Nanoarchaeia archaeon]|nr:class I SAM-dependent methyltransferase [Candidatus Nanoarchaeia archaeon]
MKDAVEITKQTYNEIARDYIKKMDSRIFSSLWLRYFCRKFLKNLPKTGKILVIGSGGGHSSLYLAKKSKYEIIGVDFSSEMIKIANEKKEKQNIKNCKFIEADIRTLKLDATYIGILADSVLYHIPKEDMPFLLKKLYTSLEENGLFWSSFKEGSGFELQENPASYPKKPRAYWFYSPAELKELFNRAGFKTKIKSLFPKFNNEKYIWVQAKK